MSHFRALRPVMPILIGASIMLTISFGLRQSLGLFMPAVTKDIAVTVTDFTIAIALQNLVWGFTQPFAGIAADKWGFRPVMLVGGFIYMLGMLTLANADSVFMILIGAGLCVGLGMSCASFAMTMSVTSRLVPPTIRSTALGMTSAAGSIGAIFIAPYGQILETTFDWRFAAYGFAALAFLIIPAAWVAGRVDKEAPLTPAANSTDSLSASGALLTALKNPRFVVMTSAYFVCGMQVVFLATHLPSYLEICGMNPMLGATAIGLIGGFNIVGSLFFGWAGGRWNKQALLGGIYCSRSVVIAIYFILPPTPTSTILFAGLMGFLWLGVSPLVSGSVIEMFGLRWQPMLQGFAFFNHQFGSFLGAFGGGWLFDKFGSYSLALQIGVTTGLVAGIIQILFALYKPPQVPASA